MWPTASTPATEIAMLRNEPAMDPAKFAKSTRALLDEDPRRYRNFGSTWFFVKALLKRFYDRHEMPILGDYEDASVNARIPAGLNAYEMMERAAEEYAQNAAFNLGSGWVEDDDGARFLLLDTDVEG
jgi:hypothetical protein